jgi:hypothetical protein
VSIAGRARLAVVILAAAGLTGCTQLKHLFGMIPAEAPTPVESPHIFRGHYSLDAGKSRFGRCWLEFEPAPYMELMRRYPHAWDTYVPGGFEFVIVFDGYQRGSVRQPGHYGTGGVYPCRITMLRLLESRMIRPRPAHLPAP